MLLRLHLLQLWIVAAPETLGRILQLAIVDILIVASSHDGLGVVVSASHDRLPADHVLIFLARLTDVGKAVLDAFLRFLGNALTNFVDVLANL